MAGKNCSSGSISASSKWRWKAVPTDSGRTTASPIWSIISAAPLRAAERGEEYELTPEQCSELQQEGIQYYHRYLSLFQIDEFEGVIRDTQRNLDLFTFVDEHSEREDLVWSFQQFRPYVLMMNTRARVSILLADGKFADAIRRDRSRAATGSSSFSSNLLFPSWKRRVPRSLFSTNGSRKCGRSGRSRNWK